MKKKLTEKQTEAIAKRTLKNRIKTLFELSGFKYFPSEGKHYIIKARDSEFDFIFLYENIIIFCEDTTTSGKHRTDHIRTKLESFQVICDNFQKFLDLLCNDFPDYKKEVNKYLPNEYIKYFLYFPNDKTGFNEEEKARFSPIIFVEPLTLEYLLLVAKSIKISSRYEIFRFLDIDTADIGKRSTSVLGKTFDPPIISTNALTGFDEGIVVVSFMMSANELMRTGYVLRKDNWENTPWLYQRMLEGKKIKEIREYLTKNKPIFLNNVIVGLPKDAKFLDHEDNTVLPTKLRDFGKYKLVLKDRMNSVCIIDGQHRVFAHYEELNKDAVEERISKIRDIQSLLVTGLFFPESMTDAQITRFQSRVFLEINSNAKPVTPSVLIHIEMLNDPISPVGLAYQVIMQLNRKSGGLEGKFDLSSIDKDKSKIKVVSVARYALKYLVSLDPSADKESFIHFWDGDILALKSVQEGAIADYISFCSYNLLVYFNAIQSRFEIEWADPECRIQTVTSINGFIIAYNHFLNKYGVRDFSFYKELFKKININFKKGSFIYKSSQYKSFANEIIRQANSILP